MLASTSDPRSATSASSHPRRPPSHLSASLRHESLNAGDTKAADSQGQPAVSATNGPFEVTLIRQSSHDSNHSEGSTGPNLQKWFDCSNRCPETGFPPNLEDSEPPYFLPRNSPSTSNALSELGAKLYPVRLGAGVLHADANGSSADDYRSVIDDLTIENKKLKRKLRKYEKAQNTLLQEDRLFEVKIHSLPARKRRELEDVLQEFASSIDSATDERGSRISGQGVRPYPSLTPEIRSLPKNPSSPTTSNEEPVDSAYASMSNSGPTSTTTLNRPLEGKLGSQQRISKEQNIQSFLHNISDGFLPNQSPVMNERQKKRIVVQRLEQLFTGYKGANIGIHSQPSQQQEVSRSAAKADQPVDHDSMAIEGIREAYILPYAMDVNSGKPVKLSDDSSHETQVTGSSDECSPNHSPEQRPTRPLDLDPNRAQIPSENVEYIRHLGLSPPQLTGEEPADAADAEGWIYLNLLINMAQLHIINVTPDFVRAAVSDVSEKFQLSLDGKKVRWRVGSQGTQLSSDSGASGAKNCSPHDSDDTDEGQRKRRKVEVGKLTSVPLNVNGVPQGVPGRSNPFHYRPLFHHRSSSSGGLLSSDESDSVFGYDTPNASGFGRIPRPSKLWSERSRLRSKRRMRNDEGPIVFYSGAKFCTDLSGDRDGIMSPLHVTDVGKDGYSNHTQTALGCKSKKSTPPLFRTTSGSLLSFRPFKDYSKGSTFLQTEQSRPKTPELLKNNSEDDIDFFVEGSPASFGPPTPLQDFEASGLGGTQPADHFSLRVHTRLTKAAASYPIKMSKISAPGPAFKKFGNSISKSSLDTFHKSEVNAPEEIIAARLASLLSLPSPSPHKPAAMSDLRFRTEVISGHFVRLVPSELPPPAGYYTTTSSSEDDYDSNDSTGTSHLKRDETFLLKSFDTDDVVVDEKDEDSSDEMEDYDSIDMLAQAREIDPRGVAAQEQEFEMELDVRESLSVPIRSSATTLNDGSGYSSDE